MTDGESTKSENEHLPTFAEDIPEDHIYPTEPGHDDITALAPGVIGQMSTLDPEELMPYIISEDGDAKLAIPFQFPVLSSGVHAIGPRETIAAWHRMTPTEYSREFAFRQANDLPCPHILHLAVIGNDDGEGEDVSETAIGQNATTGPMFQ